VAEQGLQVLVQQGPELQVVRVALVEAEAEAQPTLLVLLAVEEETELSISITKDYKRFCLL
jgi:hypothetical protein